SALSMSPAPRRRNATRTARWATPYRPPCRRSRSASFDRAVMLRARPPLIAVKPPSDAHDGRPGRPLDIGSVLHPMAGGEGQHTRSKTNARHRTITTMWQPVSTCADFWMGESSAECPDGRPSKQSRAFGLVVTAFFDCYGVAARDDRSSQCV